MPDILIRGMELESGRITEILIAPDGNVYRNRREFCLGFGPIAHATKIPPHGDLIDKGEILSDAAEVCEGCGDYAVFGYSHEQIENATVIVPAERSEDGN